MPTQKLVLLFTLVAVLGGCAIWYMKMILPAAVVSEPVTMMPAPATTPTDTTGDAAVAESATTETSATTLTPVTPAPTATAATGGSVDADIAAIAADSDATYDDSSLDAEFTSDGATVITEGYDN